MKWQEKDIMIKMRNVRTIERTFRLYRAGRLCSEIQFRSFQSRGRHGLIFHSQNIFDVGDFNIFNNRSYNDYFQCNFNQSWFLAF